MGADTPPPTSSGWYPDPVDPVRLRHWNGRAWDPRLRTLPAWAVGARDYVLVETSRRQGDPTLDGPVHAASLPAIATAGAQSSRPVPRPGAPTRLSGSRHAPGTRPPAPGWAVGARPAGSSSWSRPRTAMTVVAALIGLVVLVLAATIGFTPRPSSATTLAQDSTFIRSANIDCGEAMAAVRLAPGTTVSASGIPGTVSPAAVNTADANLARLTQRIDALPVVEAGQGLIQGWLDEWNQFGADRQQEGARAADTPTTATGAGSLASTVSLDAAQADAFAVHNDLGACTLGSTSTATLTVP